MDIGKFAPNNLRVNGCACQVDRPIGFVGDLQIPIRFLLIHQLTRDDRVIEPTDLRQGVLVEYCHDDSILGLPLHALTERRIMSCLVF